MTGTRTTTVQSTSLLVDCGGLLRCEMVTLSLFCTQNIFSRSYIMFFENFDPLDSILGIIFITRAVDTLLRGKKALIPKLFK